MDIETSTPPDIQPPTGALRVGEWRLDGGNGRRFVGTSRTVETTHVTITVEIYGEQWSDGRIERFVSFIPEVPSLTAPEAKQLARVLVAASQEIEDLEAGE